MTITPMRGQCVIREDLSVHKYRGSIIVPEVSNIDNRNAVARTRKWHIGEVLALGSPMLSKGGVPVPYGFSVGDRVLFHWVHNEKGHTLIWSDGAPACWIPQWAVDAVVEPEEVMLLSSEPNAYADFKKTIDQLEADMNAVILPPGTRLEFL